ncbi:hypothetical protein MPTK1_8g17470 [Marchantia polymorpha subsp. ruderalis]|uniref:Uncharacterized protein n=1 Tax=Marchantia polymorpha TaxID=3197 RepID=A0A2R6X8B3_MARPO|nr:hypothetical protein MARPO_0030s0081 [Marchantia polymorpha]BBN20226.1 hypothetical protein Mp_8g17470 [Marchantia polymorpha subsp. ruderalis]|eukprot:PTQ42344.1 hypothetical protein MARPO_0030s0081 [Marchantia polymorpha]
MPVAAESSRETPIPVLLRKSWPCKYLTAYRVTSEKSKSPRTRLPLEQELLWLRIEGQNGLTRVYEDSLPLSFPGVLMSPAPRFTVCSEESDEGWSFYSPRARSLARRRILKLRTYTSLPSVWPTMNQSRSSYATNRRHLLSVQRRGRGGLPLPREHWRGLSRSTFCVRSREGGERVSLMDILLEDGGRLDRLREPLIESTGQRVRVSQLHVKVVAGETGVATVLGSLVARRAT